MLAAVRPNSHQFHAVLHANYVMRRKCHNNAPASRLGHHVLGNPQNFIAIYVILQHVSAVRNHEHIARDVAFGAVPPVKAGPIWLCRPVFSFATPLRIIERKPQNRAMAGPNKIGRSDRRLKATPATPPAGICAKIRLEILTPGTFFAAIIPIPRMRCPIFFPLQSFAFQKILIFRAPSSPDRIPAPLDT